MDVSNPLEPLFTLFITNTDQFKESTNARSVVLLANLETVVKSKESSEAFETQEIKLLKLMLVMLHAYVNDIGFNNSANYTQYLDNNKYLNKNDSEKFDSFVEMTCSTKPGSSLRSLCEILLNYSDYFKWTFLILSVIESLRINEFPEWLYNTNGVNNISKKYTTKLEINERFVNSFRMLLFGVLLLRLSNDFESKSDIGSYYITREQLKKCVFIFFYNEYVPNNSREQNIIHTFFNDNISAYNLQTDTLPVRVKCLSKIVKDKIVLILQANTLSEQESLANEIIMCCEREIKKNWNDLKLTLGVGVVTAASFGLRQNNTTNTEFAFAVSKAVAAGIFSSIVINKTIKTYKGFLFYMNPPVQIYTIVVDSSLKLSKTSETGPNYIPPSIVLHDDGKMKKTFMLTTNPTFSNSNQRGGGLVPFDFIMTEIPEELSTIIQKIATIHNKINIQGLEGDYYILDSSNCSSDFVQTYVGMQQTVVNIIIPLPKLLVDAFNVLKTKG